METKGKIKIIESTVQVSDKFKRRNVVLTTGDKYPQDVIFEATQQNCELLDNFSIGDEVTIAFNLRGREWNGKYFNSLQVWKITLEAKGTKVESKDMPF